MFKKSGMKLLLLTICCMLIFIAGSKVFAGTAYRDGSFTNAKIILCDSSSDENQDAVVDSDNDNNTQKDVDNEAVIDDDDKGANKDVDNGAVIDDEDKGANKEVDQNAVMDDDSNK
jgi:hypothetical protein